MPLINRCHSYLDVFVLQMFKRLQVAISNATHACLIGSGVSREEPDVEYNCGRLCGKWQAWLGAGAEACRGRPECAPAWRCARRGCWRLRAQRIDSEPVLEIAAGGVHSYRRVAHRALHRKVLL